MNYGFWIARSEGDMVTISATACDLTSGLELGAEGGCIVGPR